mmetsp:Transcript_13866/g.46260  ORF Transcript_13866/g.46260 Transcript_13866/m.46260 type:complete len:205 (-) Transcript_13866:585-1199(-)
MRSPGSSRPTERRTSVGETCASYLCRHSASDSTPPMLVAARKSLSASGSPFAAASLLHSMAKMPPAPCGICRAQSSGCCSAAWCTLATRGCTCRNVATASAVSDWRRTRRSSVRSERSRSHVSSEPRTAPAATRYLRTASSSAPSSLRVSTTPASTSEWPESALDAECMTITTPNVASGVCSGGGANVESTTTWHSSSSAAAPT